MLPPDRPRGCTPSPRIPADSRVRPQLASEEVNQLVLQLPQAANAVEVFSTFAEHVQQLFLGLMHIR